MPKKLDPDAGLFATFTLVTGAEGGFSVAVRAGGLDATGLGGGAETAGAEAGAVDVAVDVMATGLSAFDL